MPDENLDLLKNLTGQATLIVAIGNTLKGDDAAGPLVCRHLSRSKIAVDLLDTGIVPENYIQKIIRKKPRNLLVVDAIDFGQTPGTIKIFRPEQLAAGSISTHTLSPFIFVDMVRQSVKTQVYFIGIQPAQLKLGEPISKEIHRSIKRLCRLLMDIFGSQKQGN
jgi:hydrogenase 3 maturation protease